MVVLVKVSLFISLVLTMLVVWLNLSHHSYFNGTVMLLVAIFASLELTRQFNRR